MHTLGGRNFSLFNNGGDVAFSGPGAYPSQAFASGSHSSAYEDAVRATSLFDQYPASIGAGSLGSLGSGSRLGSERLNMLGGLQMTKGGGGNAATTSDGLETQFGFGPGQSLSGRTEEQRKSSLLVSRNEDESQRKGRV